MTRLAQVSDIHCLLVANTMPTARRTGYNDTTLRQIQELREEYSIRVVEVLDTWKNWQGRAGGSAEYRRRIEIISEEIREQLQSLVGSRIQKIEDGLVGSSIPSLLCAFAEALKGYRAPSRSRSRSRSRWRHPILHNHELEQA